MIKEARDSDAYEIRSLKKAFRLIEILSNTDEMSITDLSAAVDLNKGSVFRTVSTLKSLGYIEQNQANDKYSLGIKLFEIGSRAVSRINEVRESHVILEHLFEKTQETIHLARLNEGSVVYLDKIDSKHVLRIFSRIGNRAPCYCTGLGKVLLAWLPDDELNGILKEVKMVQYTENTISKLPTLKQELKKIREQGFSIDNQEHERGILCTAAPVRNQAGRVAAAISITWPIIRNDEGRMEEYQRLIMEAAEQISRRLGYENTGART
jgi:IclR family KDG regulon transcriptional repressor